jgi:hypothetical protein
LTKADTKNFTLPFFLRSGGGMWRIALEIASVVLMSLESLSSQASKKASGELDPLSLTAGR